MLSSFGIISKGSCCFAAITRSLINWSVSVTVKAIKKKFFELITIPFSALLHRMLPFQGLPASGLCCQVSLLGRQALLIQARGLCLAHNNTGAVVARSEERRVGKESRSRWS